MRNQPRVYMGRDGINGITAIGKAGGRGIGKIHKQSIPSGGAGISPRLILASAGIARGGTMRMGQSQPKVYAGTNGMKPSRTETKMDVPSVKVQPLTEREEQLVEFFEQVEDSRAAEMEGANEESRAEETAAEVESVAAEVTEAAAEPETETETETAENEQPKKKRRRRGRRAKQEAEAEAEAVEQLIV